MGASALLITFAICVSLCSIADEADAATQIGVGYGYGSPSGCYTLALQYYDDDTLAVQAAYTGSSESSSEIGKSVFMQVCQSDGTLINESSLIRFDESFIEAYAAGYVLTTGDYLVKIYTSEHTLIVYSKLAIGVCELTIEEPSEGSITPSPGIYEVPIGTVLSTDGNALTVTFGGSTLHTFTAEPPEGKVLDGWYSGDSKISSLTIVDNTEVEVKWYFLATYTLTYDANGGSGEPDAQTYSGPEAVHEFQISNSVPTRSGYTFKGWSDTASGPAVYLPGGSITLQASSPTKTIYAVWEANPGPGPEPSYYNYTLSFDANRGEGAPETITKKSSSSSYTFTIPSKVPSRSGYEFLGWGDTGASPVYQPGSKITLTSSFPSKTLFAVWKETAIPDVKDFSMDVDVISIPEGSSVTIPYTVDPPEAAPGIVWTSSDETVATVEDGVVIAVGTGDAVITAYDSHGNRLGSVSIHVASSSEKEMIETIYTSDGGSVILVYDLDDEGEMIPSNPITVIPGTSHTVTEDQLDVVLPFIDDLLQAGRNPHVVIPSDSPVTVPSELLAAIVDGHGSLTIIEGDVTLYFPWEVLDAIGYGEDLEFVIIPIEVEESESIDIDISGLDNVKVYDIYILKNGVRVTMTFPVAVTITIDYPMKEGWTPDRLSVWYLDVEPGVPVEFEYVKGEGVVFGVMHFSHYAVSYDEGKTPADDCCVWCWILILAIIVLILFLLWFFLARRFTVTLDLGDGKIDRMPDGWEADSDSVLVRRFRYNSKLEIPDISLGDGHAIQRWTPEPEERVKGSVTYAAVIGEREGLAPAEETHGE